jgi:hypothetical protein
MKRKPLCAWCGEELTLKKGSIEFDLGKPPCRIKVGWCAGGVDPCDIKDPCFKPMAAHFREKKEFTEINAVQVIEARGPGRVIRLKTPRRKR